MDDNKKTKQFEEVDVAMVRIVERKNLGPGTFVGIQCGHDLGGAPFYHLHGTELAHWCMRCQGWVETKTLPAKFVDGLAFLVSKQQKG